MRSTVPLSGVILFAALSVFAAQQNPTPGTPKTPPAPANPPEAAKPAPAVELKNPVKPTPEGLAEAKRIYGYDCAMCHGPKGDGKGDLVDSMGLKMKDWNDPTTLAAMSDGQMYEIILKGSDKMVGEGNRVKPQTIWNLVNYVRTFEKKGEARKSPAEPAKP
jgi:mono/diheme cytochrome c family protein